jgi:hypothetical protein
MYSLAQKQLHVFEVTSFSPLARPSSDLYNVQNFVKNDTKPYVFMWDRYLIPITTFLK